MALRDIDARATRLCQSCADLPTLKVPKTFLASAEVDRAIKAFEDAHVGNDHPVVVDKEQVRQANRAYSGAERLTRPDPEEGGPTADPATDPEAKAPTAPKTDSPTDIPDVIAPPTVPKVGAPTPAAPPGGDSDGLTAGLGEAVGTLLPEAGLPQLP